MFEFNVYAGNDLKKRVGSAVFTCDYGFKRHGFCDAMYQLSDGTLVAAGELDFNASNFSLVITGGTGKYRAVAGELVAMPITGGTTTFRHRSADERRHRAWASAREPERNSPEAKAMT